MTRLASLQVLSQSVYACKQTLVDWYLSAPFAHANSIFSLGSSYVVKLDIGTGTSKLQLLQFHFQLQMTILSRHKVEMK